MSGHTKGPWTWNPEDDDCLIGKDGEAVLIMGDCYPGGGYPNEFDAKLIAAAPDLLEALIGLLEDPLGDRDPARAAIARAKGEA